LASAEFLTPLCLLCFRSLLLKAFRHPSDQQEQESHKRCQMWATWVLHF
jgi:hypothetical protein